MNTRLITFGAGHSRYRRAARRVAREARDTGLFKSVEAITERGLRRDHAAFVKQNERMLSRDVRGFGYWIWKPYLIHAALQSSSTDYVLYIDGGSVLNLAGAAARQRLREYHEMADEQGLMLMHRDHVEQVWCKADTLERTGLRGPGLSTGQAEAGFMVVKNSSFSRDLIRSWLNLCQEENYRYLDDSPSERPNAVGFNEHRHDQAIFSCLCKVAGVAMIPDECSVGSDGPFWNARHRWGSRFDITGNESLTRRLEDRVDRVESWMTERRVWAAKPGVLIDRGVSPDHWAGPRVVRYVAPVGRTLVISGRLPEEYRQLQGQQLSVWCDAESLARRPLSPGSFVWEVALPARRHGGTLQVKIRASRSFVPKRIGLNDDVRQLSYYLDDVSIIDRDETR